MEVTTLESVWQLTMNSEKMFPEKALLYIGSESYEAPTITVLQGLSDLGFSVFTIGKPNINSWFCNKVVKYNAVASLRFDFVLSDLHWGTQWDYYETLNFGSHPKVLIDGDDNPGGIGWREKHARYSQRYRKRPGRKVLEQEIQPYQWMEPLGSYEPDIVFVSQKNLGDEQSCYMPFGIHREYLELASNKTTTDRGVDFAAISGPGPKRGELGAFMAQDKLPGSVFSGAIRGQGVIAEPLRQKLVSDRRVHSYHRWIMFRDYFRLLNDTKVLIYPGVHASAWWDAKRPWEAYASGCLVMLDKPLVDMSSYPVTELCPFAVYESYEELTQKCYYLYKHQNILDGYRREVIKGALKYFGSVPLARRFLWLIAQGVS